VPAVRSRPATARAVRRLRLVPPPIAVNASTGQPNASTGSRRLLTIEDVADAVQQNFRVSAALRQALATQLASSLDYVFEAPVAQKEWMNSWPPKIGTEVLQSDLCPPLTNMLRTTRRALGTVDDAYSMQKQALPAQSVDGAWLNISRRGKVNVSWSDYTAVRASHDTIIASVLFTADRGLALFNQSPNSIFDVLAAAADELWDFVRCDYEALQTCSKWHRHVVTATVVVALYYVCAYALCAAVGLSMPLLLAVVLLPVIVLYMSYGYAPLCFPAVPVCLYDDLVYSVQQLVPKNIQLPSVLYRSQECMSAAAAGLDADCLRTCTDESFSFLEWYDVLSWWSLELGAEAGLAQLVQKKKIEEIKCLGVQTPQRMRRFPCLQDCLLTLTCHLARVYHLFETLQFLKLLISLKIIPWSHSAVLHEVLPLAEKFFKNHAVLHELQTQNERTHLILKTDSSPSK
jgi:hypothetical protein